MDAVKSAIIGRMWLNQDEVVMVPSTYVLEKDTVINASEAYLVGQLSFKIDRNFPGQLMLAAGTTLYFYANKKRAGKMDPDYTVSIRLPKPEADSIISATNANLAAYRQSQLQTA